MATVNDEKYRNAILYFAEHVRNMGKVKLWKLLYFLDFDHFEQYRTPVTGEQYLRWENGPVPATGAAVLDRMVAAQQISVSWEPTGLQYPQMKLKALQKADRSVFTESEWDMLQCVARKWRHHSGRDMINATHGEPPWRDTEPDAVIDYKLALQRDSAGDVDNLGGQDTTEEKETDMRTTTEIDLAREQTLAYAKRIEHLWNTDPQVRARIERGIEQLEAGEVVPVDIDALLAQRRDRTPPPQ